MEENKKLVQFIFNENREVVVEKSNSDIKRLIRSYDLWASECEPEKTWYHYASDEQGSIVFITDEEKVCNKYDYDTWGNLTTCKEIIPNRFLYTGQQFDQITQQYYLRARYYNPIIARFTKEDVYRGDGLNLYTYCDNNPVIYYDPSGYVCDELKDIYKKYRKKGLSPSEAYKFAKEDISINLPLYNGKNTYGILVLPDKTPIRFVSGNAPSEYKNYIAASHVEGKAAIYMRKNNIPEGVLYHNNPGGICPYCDKMLQTLLEKDSKLIVVPPKNAISKKYGWISHKKVYIGNDKILKINKK